MTHHHRPRQDNLPNIAVSFGHQRECDIPRTWCNVSGFLAFETSDARSSTSSSPTVAAGALVRAAITIRTVYDKDTMSITPMDARGPLMNDELFNQCPIWLHPKHGSFVVAPPSPPVPVRAPIPEPYSPPPCPPVALLGGSSAHSKKLHLSFASIIFAHTQKILPLFAFSFWLVLCTPAWPHLHFLASGSSSCAEFVYGRFAGTVVLGLEGGGGWLEGELSSTNWKNRQQLSSVFGHPHRSLPAEAPAVVRFWIANNPHEHLGGPNSEGKAAAMASTRAVDACLLREVGARVVAGAGGGR